MKKIIITAILLTLFNMANANTLDFYAIPETLSKTNEWVGLLLIVILIAIKKSAILR